MDWEIYDAVHQPFRTYCFLSSLWWIHIFKLCCSSISIDASREHIINEKILIWYNNWEQPKILRLLKTYQ
jgi:hypothetical protein